MGIPYFKILFGLLLAVVVNTSIATGQTLDRIDISSGGLADDQLNASIGQLFAFTLDGASGGISLSSGALTDTSFLGGLDIAVADTIQDTTTVPDTTTSVQEIIYPKGKVVFYPNPVQSYLNLNLKNFADGKYTFKILTVDGETIHEGNFTQKDNQLALWVGDFEAATYVVFVANENQKLLHSFKFIKAD